MFSRLKGRWLHRNDERQEARRLRFDFDALLGLAIDRSPGATRVLSCDKKEGGFNRVFVIRLDNGKSVIARLPTKLAGPLRTTVSSEVATLQFVKKFTKIPVPDVLAWSSQSDNPVGAEYIIMNEIPGALLKDVWNTMTASQHITCIQSIALLIKELCAVDVPHYGSLYSPADGQTGLLALDTHYAIGPLCKAHHHANQLGQTDDLRNPDENFGPWTSLDAYYADHFRKAHSHVPTELTQHAELLNIAHKTIQTLIDQDSIRRAGAPLLSHPDLHTRNIFVRPEDPTVITGIIDWQSAAVEPAYVFAAETPDFAAELPEQEASEQASVDEDSTESQAFANLKADVDFCVRTWSIVPSICPKFREASQLDGSVLQLLAAPSNGWLDDADSLRCLLSNVEQKWTELGLPGESFYQATQEEAAALETRLDRRRATQRLQEFLARRLGCDNDGWVAAGRWDVVLPQYREIYRSFVESVAESDPGEDADDLWPFDQR